MQELTFEQVGIVAGGEGSGDGGASESVETDTIKKKQDATGSNSGRDVTISCCSGNVGPISYNVPVFNYNFSSYIRGVAARPLPTAAELNSAVENGMRGSML
ncbi:hypothetical protein [Rheinheimera salexigens]|uniref:Uncharacterized protein n=1 Tax=Rheinheimera salexigens TaxID=1628148 RepID=A0A1E7Q222_9GAMM|nr:hypothetical protein [Rheinheimera salexigens]OEY68245.1 hypothetical protein BI198_00700 [Rheinheimera salexigens]